MNLNRATNVLTPRGEPVPAMAEIMRELESQAGPPSAAYGSSWQSSGRLLTRSGISGSIQRKFRDLRRDASKISDRISRSRSLSPTAIHNTASLKRKGHFRSKSDAQPTTARRGELLPQHRSRAAGYAEMVSPAAPEGGRPDIPAQMSDVQDLPVPQALQLGTPMRKVTQKKMKQYVFRLDVDQGQIVWESKKLRIIPIENIKELRSGSEARYYREYFRLAQEYEDLWITIVYVMDGGYKTLHLITPSKDMFHVWDVTLRKLYDIRQQLMNGAATVEMRQAIWEKQFWKSADKEADHKLDFDEVERLCRKLNINPSRDDLHRRFKQADSQTRGYLDFPDFQRFVKSLKSRPEIDRLYKKLISGSIGMNYELFESFMKTTQKSTLSRDELCRLFLRYAISASTKQDPDELDSPRRNGIDLTAQAPSLSPSPTTSPAVAIELELTIDNTIMNLKGFTSFLLSTDNSVFTDQNGKIWHDMTRPLPEYFISSSHNTYLVGHQLVGDSTIEGYIRALLHSCRSVELDIYDGDNEPMIYHGRTLTTKVSLRATCEAIAKYAFVASPYPIIISAEVHCGLTQQDMIVNIMKEVFGDALVSAPINGRLKIEELPSPEDLKGRVLLKAKNLYVSDKEGLQEREVSIDTESSSTETSASDSELREEIKHEIKHEWRKARENEAEMIKDFKYEFKKARDALGRVRSPRRRSTAPPAAAERPKAKMSFALVALLVYTVGVKCRGINKKEMYAPEHVFSLSENTANKILKQGMMDLIKHNRTHLVRIYPKGMRIGSTNYEPHRYWSAGAQLVAINWQTFDLGYMINHAMFQRNGRAGYVLKPLALRADKQLLSKRTNHYLNLIIISAQQLPRPKDALGRDVADKNIVDPYVEVSLHVPDWTQAPYLPDDSKRAYSPPSGPSISGTGATSARTITRRSGAVKNNGFNPVWEQGLSLPFDCVGDMRELIFVRFTVKQEDKEDEEPLAVYCASLGSLNFGYRHLPLHDGQLSQYLFSTLFVHIDIRDT